jgi:hypothetical protein
VTIGSDYVPRAHDRFERWMIMKGDEHKNAKTRSKKDGAGSADGMRLAEKRKIGK